MRSTPGGLSSREVGRRLAVTGPNELARRGGRRWPGELAARLATVAPFPLLARGADEIRRAVVRRRHRPVSAP